MTVYVVLGTSFDGDFLECVHSTLEAAQEKCRKLNGYSQKKDMKWQHSEDALTWWNDGNYKIEVCTLLD